MDKVHFHYVAAASYSCGAYGVGKFNENCSTATGSTDGSPSGDGSGTTTTAGTDPGANAGGVTGLLANTGYGVLLPVALGLAIVFAASILLVKRVRRRVAAARTE